jgi:hypothetical protein
VSYYEIGTALTANHGHAAMMGVYGMLALGLAMFCLRYLGIRHTVKRVTLEEPEDILFTELDQPEGVPRVGPAEASAAKLT